MIMKDKVLLKDPVFNDTGLGFHQDGFVCFCFSRDDRMVSGLDFLSAGSFGFGFSGFSDWILILFLKDKVFLLNRV